MIVGWIAQLTTMLPPYRERRTCSKCGSIGVATRFDPITETMVRTCSRCDHHWRERPLDHAS